MRDIDGKDDATRVRDALELLREEMGPDELEELQVGCSRDARGWPVFRFQRMRAPQAEVRNAKIARALTLLLAAVHERAIKIDDGVAICCSSCPGIGRLVNGRCAHCRGCKL